jgi:hypothetical protein
MAKKSRPTFQKREKEKARQQRQKEKEQRRMESKERPRAPRIEGEDPDIAGIRPGPQALPEHKLFSITIDPPINPGR